MEKSRHEKLVHVVAGAPMGDLMRRYWIPACLSSELPENDCPQIRLPLLGEQLIAFRDSEGRVGLVAEACAHRGVSLFFGRVEQGGIRCCYHGWKFDVTGRCLELPQQPEYAGKVRIKAYPCVERGDVVWTYMGPPEHRPPLPELEWCMLPKGYTYNSRHLQECNWLQALEGGLDNAHLSFLHSTEFGQDPLHHRTGSVRYLVNDPNPIYDVHPSDGGLMLLTRRNGDPGTFYYRVTQFVMPWYTCVPAPGPHPLIAHAWVPIDDENTWTWTMSYYVDKPLNEEEVAIMAAGKGPHALCEPGTLRPVANRDNDYLIDRAAQKEGRLYSGVKTFSLQDQSVQESMGKIFDRSNENLIQTDQGIVRARRLMLDALGKHEQGEDPPGLKPQHQRVRAGSMVLDESVDVAEWAALALQTGPEHRLYSV